MIRSDIVTDPAVIARLPKTCAKISFCWTRVTVSLGFAWRALRRRGWRDARFHLRFMLYAYARFANAEVYSVGPLEVVRPAPWLIGPAQQLHPEAFEVQP